MQKILTIAVPTINRPYQIEKTLNNLLIQNKKHNLFNKINILILDSSKNLETRNIISKEIINASNLIYIHDNKNLGFDSALIKLAQKCDTKYIWFINDHSTISDNNFENIINILENNSYSYLYAPSKGFNNYNYKKSNIKSNVLKGTNMNCNIYNVNDFILYCNKFIDKYNNTYLLFYIAQIYIVYENLKCITLQFECTEYGTYISKERQINSWSGNRKKYIQTTYYIHLILLDFIKKFNEKKYLEISIREDMNFILSYINKDNNEKYIVSKKIINIISSKELHSQIGYILLKIILKYNFISKSLIYIKIFTQQNLKYLFKKI